MKKFTALQKSGCIMAWLLLLFNFDFVNAQGFSPQTQSRLQQVLRNFQNDPSFVGGISAAIKVDGLASWQGATGYAARNVDAQNNLLPGGTEFTTNTLSQIYSVTKTFTAALALELAKAGAFNLNDQVNKYLPLNQVNPSLNNSVTIRQLLAHESGYSDYTSEFQFLLAVAFQPTHIWTPFEVVYFVHQQSQPGTERHYSSTNYVLLGAIIEAVTGKTIQQHFRVRFFTPLHLNSMYLAVREPQPSGTQLASPHDNISAFNPIFQLTGQPTFPDAYTNISRFPFDGIVSAAFTGGGIVSDAKDVAEWGNALFNGSATNAATLDSMLSSISSTPDAQGDYLGYGIWKSTKMSATETFLGHDGNAPGYRSVMFYQPDKKLTLVVLTNFNGADIYAIAKALYAALPRFTCGNTNRKEEKIKICFSGNSMCVDRNAATGFINKGAYLGDCEVSSGKTIKKIDQQEKKIILNAYPNPFSTKVQISFSVPATGEVSLDLYDMQGKLVSKVFRGNTDKGMTRQFEFDASKLSQGIYLLNLKTEKGIVQQKLSLNR